MTEATLSRNAEQNAWRHAPSQDFEVRPFNAPVGAEVVGLDISKPINDADFARLHRAHLDHHVVVFRDQRVSPDDPAQHVA